MNKPLEIASVMLAYQAQHGPLPDGTEGGKYLPSSPLKFAVRAGKVPELLESLQASTQNGSPFDFASFVAQFSEASAKN